MKTTKVTKQLTEGKLKISPEHYAELKNRIAALAHKIPAHREALKKDAKYQPGGKGDLGMRVRWDAFHASKMHNDHNLYNHGLNDDHIDSALKSIFSELNLNESVISESSQVDRDFQAGRRAAARLSPDQIAHLRTKALAKHKHHNMESWAHEAALKELRSGDALHKQVSDKLSTHRKNATRLASFARGLSESVQLEEADESFKHSDGSPVGPRGKAILRAEKKFRKKGQDVVYAGREDDADDHFSWHSCQMCGSKLGGNRARLALLSANKKGGMKVDDHLEACTDCAHYVANGELPLDDNEDD